MFNPRNPLIFEPRKIDIKPKIIKVEQPPTDLEMWLRRAQSGPPPVPVDCVSRHFKRPAPSTAAKVDVPREPSHLPILTMTEKIEHNETSELVSDIVSAKPSCGISLDNEFHKIPAKQCINDSSEAVLLEKPSIVQPPETVSDQIPAKPSMNESSERTSDDVPASPPVEISLQNMFDRILAKPCIDETSESIILAKPSVNQCSESASDKVPPKHSVEISMGTKFEKIPATPWMEDMIPANSSVETSSKTGSDKLSANPYVDKSSQTGSDTIPAEPSIDDSSDASKKAEAKKIELDKKWNVAIRNTNATAAALDGMLTLDLGVSASSVMAREAADFDLTTVSMKERFPPINRANITADDLAIFPESVLGMLYVVRSVSSTRRWYHVDVTGLDVDCD
ncbi:hypothetical protein EDC01DRAFT_755841 [Geopyxis carbonaria]|nr:hypothetical protein EDC01DRAFT_755841 [Geopyxis carbonaria]